MTKRRGIIAARSGRSDMSFSGRIPFAVALSFLAGAPTQAADVTIQSGPARVHLLELFTSEGCSSCPPAERWFATLRASPRLWKDFVPVAFHVDYWDGLGWKDRLASAANTARQRTYASAWGSSTVYTPGFVLDGREWRGRDIGAIPTSAGNVGILSVRVREGGEIAVAFQPAANGAIHWQADVALLKSGLATDVKAGENTGRTLPHDFVVLAHESAAMSASGVEVRATLKLPLPRDRALSEVAVWITEAGKTEPVQAAGGAL